MFIVKQGSPVCWGEGGGRFLSTKPNGKTLVSSKSLQCWETKWSKPDPPFKKEEKKEREKKHFGLESPQESYFPPVSESPFIKGAFSTPPSPASQTLRSIISHASRKSLEIFGNEIMCHCGTKVAKNSMQTDFPEGVSLPSFSFLRAGHRGGR